MLQGKKIAGILLERNGYRIAVGIGINLASAPAVPGKETASFGGEIAPEAFAPLLAGCFARLLDLWRKSEPASLAKAWLARAHPLGTALSVHSTNDEIVSGRFEGIQPDGALILRREDGGIDIVRAGDVQLD
jgi:BirA family biotin operon repressor/biotin-[acetyl-CoA-carboxylase] ligase